MNGRVAFCEMAYASATFDCGLLLDAFETLGLKFKREKITEDLGSMRWILRDIVPAEEARRRMAAVEKMEAERAAKQPKGEQVAWESKAYPGEFFFYLRANELMQGLGSTLDVTMPFLDLVKPYARHGLITHPLFSKVCHVQVLSCYCAVLEITVISRSFFFLQGH